MAEQPEILGRKLNETEYLIIQEIKKGLMEMYKDHFGIDEASLDMISFDTLALKLYDKLKNRLNIQLIER